MAITQAIANSFKKELLEGEHNFGTGDDKFKIALYLSSATLNSATTAFTATGEVDFADRSFTGVTLTARGALIYNTSATATNAAVCALDFGADKTATAGVFTIQFPAATSTAAILRISG